MEKLTNEFKIEFTKGDTYALAIKFKNITEDLRTAYFSVKENADDSPLIQKSLGAGIDKIDDRGYKNEKTYKFQLQPIDTLHLEAKVQYLYDIQVAVGNVVKTVLHGVFVLGNTITGTKSVTQEMEVAIDDELETEVLTTPATNGVEYEQDPIAIAKIGDLSILDTDNKETVVNAINEVNKNADTNAEEINKIKNGTYDLPSAKNVSETINGKNISDILEDDGLTVKNSTNATYCQYASQDTSKGTIEERLTNLGFKQGVADYSNLEIGNASVNSLKKQGKYVIFNFEANCNIEAGNFKYITIPTEFMPKEAIKIPVIYTSSNTTGNQAMTASIVIESGNISFMAYINTGDIQSLKILNVGWETN